MITVYASTFLICACAFRAAYYASLNRPQKQPGMGNRLFTMALVAACTLLLVDKINTAEQACSERDALFYQSG